MALSDELVRQFAKLTAGEKDTNKESTVYGTVVDFNGEKYVKLDGSDQLTPVTSTTRIDEDDRVTVMIKNHTATVTGNVSSPVPRGDDFDTLGENVKVMDTVLADKVSTKDLEATNAEIDNLKVKNAEINELVVNKADISELEAIDIKVTGKFTAVEADIEDLTNKNLTVTGKVTANEASINNLQAKDVEIERLVAEKADVEDLNATNAEITNLVTKYATIDFANIGEAAIVKLFSSSGIIEDLVVSDGHITGELVGVTIKGDVIEGGTVKADKLVVKGSDGLFYKLNVEGNSVEAEQTEYNSLNGSVITAKSVTAEKINVNDLIAFRATIAGFNLTEDAIYSGVKAHIDNPTQGIYLGNDGQINIGDTDHFFKYYKVTDAEGNESYRLAISADSILFGADSQTSMSDVKTLTEHVKVDLEYNNPLTGEVQPAVILAEGDSEFKQIITNTETIFTDRDNVSTVIGKDGLKTTNIEVESEIKQNYFVTSVRTNGNRGTRWTGGENLFVSTRAPRTSSDYVVGSYYPSEPLIEGETYTCTMSVTPAPGVTRVSICSCGGGIGLTWYEVSGTGTQTIGGPFTMQYVSDANPSIGTSGIHCFRYPNDGTVTGATTIHWMKVEKGSTATPWCPHKDDIG